MFNDYEVFQIMKLRQEETERNARKAWKQFLNPEEKKELKKITFPSQTQVDQCCQCTCA